MCCLVWTTHKRNKKEVYIEFPNIIWKWNFKKQADIGYKKNQRG